MLVKIMNSISRRITGLMFLLIVATVFLLSYLADYQMSVQFSDYLYNRPASGMMANSHMMAMMGAHEQAFLANTHKSLVWYGAGIVVIGLIASYFMAQSITVPLRRLNAAVEAIEQGELGQTVPVQSDDEVGQLAQAFNRMSHALEINNQLRKRLLADVAHELRTPLTVIQGNLEGMLDGVIEPSSEQLESLYEETVYLNKIIRELRDLSLAEAGQLRLDKQQSDINLLVNRAVQLMKPLADEKRIQFICDLREVPQVQLDTSRINQVIYNLLSNALRYTPDGGQVKIITATSAEGAKRFLTISVRDNGKGISATDLPHIFEHFYRADLARDRKSGGSGIGLAIVKQLVELHSGRVEVKSEIGIGSEFTIYLPIIQ